MYHRRQQHPSLMVVVEDYDPNETIQRVRCERTLVNHPYDSLDGVVVADTTAFCEETWCIDDVMRRGVPVYTTDGVAHELKRNSFRKEGVNPNVLRKQETLLRLLSRRGHLIQVDAQNLPFAKREYALLQRLKGITSKSLAYIVFRGHLDALIRHIEGVENDFRGSTPFAAAKRMIGYMRQVRSGRLPHHAERRYQALGKVYSTMLREYVATVEHNFSDLQREFETYNLRQVRDLWRPKMDIFLWVTRSFIFAMNSQLRRRRVPIAETLDNYWTGRYTADTGVVLAAYAHPIRVDRSSKYTPPDQSNCRSRNGYVGRSFDSEDVTLVSRDQDIHQMVALRQRIRVPYT